MEPGRTDGLHRIRTIMDSMETARSVVPMFCHPVRRTMDMPGAHRLSRDAQRNCHAAEPDCLSAAHAALKAGCLVVPADADRGTGPAHHRVSAPGVADAHGRGGGPCGGWNNETQNGTSQVLCRDARKVRLQVFVPSPTESPGCGLVAARLLDEPLTYCPHTAIIQTEGRRVRGHPPPCGARPPDFVNPVSAPRRKCNSYGATAFTGSASEPPQPL